MGKTTYYPKRQIMDKLSKQEKLDLTFDLINAFRLVKDPLETTLLIQDLLTSNEIKNLSKRLRIAKLLLQPLTQRDISREVKCSIATVTKVNEWLKLGGIGFKSVIKRLPKRYSYPKKLKGIPLEFQLPSLIMSMTQYGLFKKQTKEIIGLENFLENIENKKLLDKQLKEIFSDHYKNKS